MDEVYEDAASSREASGEALTAVDEWRGMVSRSPSEGAHLVSADAAHGADEAPAEEATEVGCIFEVLPVEMLSAVLAWLDWETLLKAAPAVCRTWRAVCHDLVPAAFEFPGNCKVGDGVLRAIGARFKKTRGVSLGRGSSLTVRVAFIGP